MNGDGVSNEAQCDIGLVGLAVMGQNLILNMNDHGFKAVAYNRTTEKIDRFLKNEAKGTDIVGAYSVEELCAKLKRPRRILLMVKAGAPVDDFIDQVLPHLEPGDIIIDGGNSHYDDTARRVERLEKAGFLYVGCGVSGGELGARNGPSMMPGGSSDAWGSIKDIFQAVAAKVGGKPCCEWVGHGASGHYVKMVHNGIEYGDMQLICEAYAVMREVLEMSNAECADVFTKWNGGKLASYLIEITADILNFKDDGDRYVVDYVMDKAAQKGTGKWTVQSALDLGSPATLMGVAVFARTLSALKKERIHASKKLRAEGTTKYTGSRSNLVSALHDALYASKIASYAQCYQLLALAAANYGWALNYAGIALMWRGGCIIRSRFLGSVRDAYVRDPKLPNLLLDGFFANEVGEAQEGWRELVAVTARAGVPTPAFSAALAYFDSYRSDRLPANLLMAMRDLFGAHTFERIDQPGFFHIDWTGQGGTVTSNAYSA